MAEIRIESEFANGSKSFRMADKRLVKLSKGTLDDMMDLIKPNQVVRGGAVSIFVHHWLNSQELVAGFENCQREQWDSEPTWTHKPYCYCDEFILILGLLTGRDLSLLASFAAETEWRNSTSYRSWLRAKQGAQPIYLGDKSRVCTTIVE